MIPLADMFAVGTTFEFEGQTHTLRKPTLIEQGQFQRWLEQDAAEVAARITVNLSEKEQAAALNTVVRDTVAGVYEYDGEVAVKSRWSYKGTAKLFQILFKIDNDTARRLIEAEAWKKANLFAEVVNADDPKAATEALAALLTSIGLPSDWLSPDFLTRPSGASKTSPPSGTSTTTNSGASGATSSATSEPGNPKPPAGSPSGPSATTTPSAATSSS